MSDIKPIDENGLDNLLRDLYLEENSKTPNEDSADFVLGQEYPVKINSDREKELLKRLQNKKGLGGFRFYFSLFLIISLSISLWIYFSKLNSVSAGPNKTRQNYIANEIKTGDTPVTKSGYSTDLVKNNRIPVKVADTFGRQTIVLTIHDSLSPNNNGFSEKTGRMAETSVPYITEKDKLRYLKIKNQILYKLIKSDKGLYTHLDANKISYAGKDVIIDAFTIRNVGISNLEYKTFLADLLIQKRHEDYLIAQAAPENWLRYNCTALSNTYFQAEKYNDFPVVNITYEGAKLFCKWLEEEVKIYMQQNNLKIKPLTIRLPYDEEWIYAAEDGYAKIAFEKGYNTIYDITEGLVDKSFSRRAETIKKRVKRIDTLYTLFTTNRFGWSEKEIIDFFGLGFKSFSSTTADTIYIDRMKVLGKIGKVSEIVCQRNTSTLWFCGLSWKNKMEYIKLGNEFKTNHSSPLVGFRPVIINSKDPVYKRPFY